MQFLRLEPHLHREALGVIGRSPIGRKQRQLARPPALVVEGLDRPPPCRLLAVVDLAQIKHRALHHPAASTALAFDNAPVTVLFAVLLPPGCPSISLGWR
jgi:hypothetical protein